MNPARTVKWTCRAVRTWRAVAGDTSDAAPSRPADRSLMGRHIARCPECQAYFARLATLDAALRSTGYSAAPATPDDLHRRIMRTVADSRAGASPRHHLPVPALIAIGAAVALVVVAVFIPARRRLAPHRASTPIVAATPPTTPAPVASTVAPKRIPSRMLPSSPATDSLDPLTPVASALAQDPLQLEIDSVYADAQDAVRFLALNFLPTTAVADVRRVPGSGRRSNGG